MRPLYGHQDFVLCVAFSPDGRWLASGGADNRILVWDLLQGTGTELPYQPQSWAACLRFSPNNRWLAIGEHHGRLILYDRENNTHEAGPALTLATLSGLGFTPDGLNLAWCDYSGGVGIWPLGQSPRMLIRERHEQFALVVSPQGRYLAAAGRNNHVLVWELPGDRQPVVLDFPGSEGCRALVFDQRERTLIAGLGAGLMAWDLDEGQTLWQAEHPGVVSGVGLSRDGRLIASGSWDGMVRLYARDPCDSAPPYLQRVFDFGQRKIFDLELSSDGMVGAVAGEMPEPLILWDVD